MSRSILDNMGISMLDLIKRLLSATVIRIDKTGAKGISDNEIIIVHESQIVQKGEYLIHKARPVPFPDFLTNFVKHGFPNYDEKTETLWFFDLDLSQEFVVAKIPVKSKNIVIYTSKNNTFTTVKRSELSSNQCVRLKKSECCGNPSCMARVASTKRCAKCLMVSYCSKECQAQHWVVHKKFCKENLENRKGKK